MLIGIDSVISRLNRIQKNIPEAAEKSLYKVGKDIMKVAVNKTPEKTGALKKSALVSHPVTSGNKTKMVLSFGGPSAPYAIYVHENLKVNHRRGQAKFLEIAIEESASYVGNEIASEILHSWSSS